MQTLVIFQKYSKTKFTSFMGIRSFNISQYLRNTGIGACTLTNVNPPTTSSSRSNPCSLILSSKADLRFQPSMSTGALALDDETSTKSTDISPGAESNVMLSG